MSGNYEDVGKGAISLNEEKRSPKSPDFKGSVEIEGKHYWVSGWNRTNRQDGSEFISLAFQPKRASQHQGGSANPPAQRAKTANRWDQNQPAPRPAESKGDEFDDDIPF